MGWTGTQTNKPNHELITEEIEWGPSRTHTVVGRSGKYYAVRNNTTGNVFGLVGLVQSRDGWKYTKLVDEDMGPCEKACPARILDMLTPTTSKYATEWRAACRKRAERAKAAPKVTAGTTIQLVTPVSFSDDVKEDTFTFVKGYRFTRHCDNRLVRLPKSWRAGLAWSVV